MSTSTQVHEFSEEVVEYDFLICPDDLQEIMRDLRGEELTLEELAMTLLSGGIELEYLSTKYKTSAGYKTLLVVIACQDSLTVDFEDLSRRCEEVALAMVGDHLRLDETMHEQFMHDPDSLVYIAHPENEIPFGEFHSRSVFQYANYVASLAWVRTVLERTPKVHLTKGGIAPTWMEPNVGPYRRLPGGEASPQCPKRGTKATVSMDSMPPRKGLVELLHREAKPPDKRRKTGLTPSLFGKVIKEDFDKWYEVLGEWSKGTLDTILESPENSQDPLLLEEEGPS